MSPKERLEWYRSKKKEKKNKQNRQSYRKLHPKPEYSGSKAAVRKRKQRDNIRKKEKQKEKSTVRVKKFRSKLNSTPSNGNETRIKSSNVFKNRMEKTRAIKRLKDSLPKSPNKRSAVLSTYLSKRSPDSPTVLVLKSTFSPLETTVIDNIKEVIQSTKMKRSKNALSVMHAVTASVSGESIGTSRCKMKLAKVLGVPARRLSGGKRIRTKILKSEASAWDFTTRKTRSDSIDEKTKKVVYDFWLSPGISHPTGNKSDIKRERLGPKVYTSHMVHVLEKTQTEAYVEFISKFPEIKIGQRSFEKLKPYFVRSALPKDRNTCCCRYHVEIQLLFKSCMTFRRKNQDTEDEELQPTIFSKLSEVVDATLCEKDGDYHNKLCLDRKCSKCGVNNFEISDKELDISDSAPEVEWDKYEYTQENSDKQNTRRRLTLTRKKTKVGEMFVYFRNLLESFPSHQHRAIWQNMQMKSLLQNLPFGHCVCVHDFSENYRCSEKNEIQSNYFQRTECSLHVTIIHRHAILEYDGLESTEEFPEIITEHFFVVSPDLQHDNYFTSHVQKQIRDYLDSISYPVTIMHEFTDGCSAQYKSRHCLGDLSRTVSELGYERIQRNYFETSHAKGPQDAAGGYVKRQADISVLRGNVKIRNAKDLFNFCQKSLVSSRSAVCKRRIFRYTESINHDQNRRFKPVSHNREIHQARSTEEGVISVFNLSCYTCGSCVSGEYEMCENLSHVGSKRTIQMKQELGREVSLEEEIDNDNISSNDLLSINSIIAVKADDKFLDYYLLKVTSLPEVLNTTSKDDWGIEYPAGFEIIKGLYYDRVKSNPLAYKLIPRKLAFVPAQSLIYICAELETHNRVILPEPLHLDILAVVDSSE